MANNVSNKSPAAGHVIYDSVNDTSTGKKRAVQLSGGVSVAERARMFGTLVSHSSATKNLKPPNQQIQKPPLNNQSTKSNVIRQERNYPPPKTDVDRRPKQDPYYSTPSTVRKNDRSPTPIDDTSKRTEPSSSTDSPNYSTLTRSHGYNRYPSSYQQPITNYDTFQYVKPQKRASAKPNYTKIRPSESYASDDDPYDDSYDRHQPPASHYQKQPSSHHQRPPRTTYQPSSYFQPIKDPLDVLFRDAPHEYIQHDPSQTIHADTNSMQPFDLGNLINRIQQDYLDNVRPYVSSVQFVQNEQNLANIGFLTPSTNRKDYTRRPNDAYSRRVPSYQFDVINANDHYSYDKRYSKQATNANQYSSMTRRRHLAHHHDQGSSPIHVLKTTNKMNTKHQRESPPAPKVPTPVVSSSSEEEEEEEVKPKVIQPVLPKPVETESESEEESEDIPPPVPAPISLQSVNGTVHAPITPAATTPQRNEVIRGPLPTKTPAKASETEESESEESKSESESDSEDEKPKPKPKPPPPATPSTNARVTAQRATTNTSNDPPEPSNSATSFDVQNSGKSSIGNKFQSIKNKLRRK